MLSLSVFILRTFLRIDNRFDKPKTEKQHRAHTFSKQTKRKWKRVELSFLSEIINVAIMQHNVLLLRRNENNETKWCISTLQIFVVRNGENSISLKVLHGECFVWNYGIRWKCRFSKFSSYQILATFTSKFSPEVFQIIILIITFTPNSQ